MLNIVITAGGTSEPIDNVRKITNSSTGKLGAVIAEELLKREDVGKIFYIKAKKAITPPLGVYVVNENKKLEIIEKSEMEIASDFNDFEDVQKLKETKTNLVYPTKDEDGKEAITNYKVIKETDNYSMVSINIETGRKNQIRVAFQTLRNPIVGDKKYGDPRDKETRLYLHANRLKMYYPELKKDILFETTTPNEFKKIMNQ